jgi:hypothetical protein
MEKKLSECENKIIANKKQYEKDILVNNQLIEKLNRKIQNYERILKSANNVVVRKESREKKSIDSNINSVNVNLVFNL